MVMEAPPSPQSVGREFVRQYYTLLNKAPTHLHRFYNHQSSFIHGGLDPPNRETSPVIGQKEIHQKIQQLNFRDCHAKITQVDSQATLGEGVVVQVTGELSNGGQPMRRFTQTFVLASQSPKKYYVHNDIFRYQDEIISDEDCDVENRSEPEDDVQTINQGPIPSYYNPAGAPPMQASIPPVHHQQQPPHVLAPQALPTVNGAVHPDDINVISGGPVPVHVSAAQGPVMAAPIASMQPAGLVQAQISQPPIIEEAPQVAEVLPVEETHEMNFKDVGDHQDQEPQDPIAEPVLTSSSSLNEPKTFANLFKSGNNVSFNSPPMASVVLAQPPRSASPPAMGNRGDQGGSVMRNNSTRTPRAPPQNPRIQKQDSGRTPGRNSFNEDVDDRKRSQGNSFSDTFQLFLGNLPHDATEEDLADIFSKFGAISDLRVHSKPSKPVVGGRAPPNYGFITYESQVGVQNCLAARPIFYPKDDKNGTQLNVEEKKVKDRTPYGGGGGGGRPNNDRDRQRDGGGPRRGPGGGMGGGGPRNSGGGGGTNNGGGGSTGITPNRTSNNYNRSGGGGGPPNNRGLNNAYGNRR